MATMIKKLDIKDYKDKKQLVWFGIIYKINELVDAVNGILDYAPLEMAMKAEPKTRAENVQPDTESRLENVQDPYTEQRKWIGKLCWFWNNDNEPDTCFGVLTGLFDEADRPFERSIGQQLYRYCEPVKPDDDIIFKGGDNVSKR